MLLSGTFYQCQYILWNSLGIFAKSPSWWLGRHFFKHFKDFKHPFSGKLSGTIFMVNNIMFKLRIIVITNQDYHAAGFLRFYPLFCFVFLMLAYAGGIWVCFSIYPDFRASEELLGVTRWLSCVRVNSQQCQFYCSHIEQLVHTHQIQHRPKALDLLYMQCRHIYFSPGNFGWI